MERIASKPTTTTTNTLNINNFTPITSQLFSDEASNLTLDHIGEPNGKGYVRFIEELCQDKIICTDYSRNILKWKNEEDVISDPKGEKLWKTLCIGLLPRNEEIREEIQDKVSVDPPPGETELYLERLGSFGRCSRRYIENTAAIRFGAEGKESRLHKVVIENLCRLFKR